MSAPATLCPYFSLKVAPTNLKEAIDWVLRVTGKDGKKNDECICGLAAAVTDLLQSVELEYNGYQGETKGTETNKGATEQDVTNHLNGLFSLVQGLGGTAVVRTYIDQLAQVLSALVGWSKIEQCKNVGNGNCKDKEHGKNEKCQYLKDVDRTDRSCGKCGCIKGGSAEHLGRGCTKCDGDKCGAENFGREYNALDGYRSAYPSDAFYKRNTFLKSDKIENPPSWNNLKCSPLGSTATNSGTITDRRQHCARIFLGSVCLIWSGITYMYWTGKYHKTSPRWNNHILDGSGLDDGTLSQWLQALGFPKAMLNDAGPGNRLDQVITDEFREKLYVGFPDTSSGTHGQDDWENTFRDPAGMNFAGYIHTLEKGAFDSSVFKEDGSVPDQHKLGPLFKLYILSCAYFTGLQNKAPPKAENKTPRTIREILYWLSALPYSQAYKEMLTYGKGRLQEVLKKPGDSDPSTGNEQKQLKFIQTDRPAPITVDEYNLFAHFQAVTQYCPLVLIGIQGGLHSTKSANEPAIHALYANTECNFTYPTVDIQAYNQVVHYIRGLFYQLYFLRKQCAVKVTCGGKWRECRYGSGVLGKGVVSWMCLGCDPMEHDRNYRVNELKRTLGGVKSEAAGTVSTAIKELLVPLGRVVVALGNAQEALERGEKEGIYQSMVIGLVEALGGVVGAVKEVVDVLEQDTSTSPGQLKEPLKGVLEKVLVKVIDVVLGVVKKLEEGVKKNGKEAQDALKKAQAALEGAKNDLEKGAKKDLWNGNSNLGTAKGNLESLSKKDGNGSLQEMWEKLGSDKKALKGFINVSDGKLQVDPGKNTVSEFIHRVRELLTLLKQIAEKDVKGNGNSQYYYQTRIHVIIPAIENMFDIVGSTRCVHCRDHANKCGKKPVSKICEKCHQQYMDGTPSPLQAFLEDRLPGFSCQEVLNTDTDIDTQYPPAASHLGHCGGSGQCCPLPMGFRGQFQEGITHIGQRLYGILYFFSNENMMQSCVYTLVRVTAALSATTPQVLGDVFGFFRGGVGNPVDEKGEKKGPCNHNEDPSKSENKEKYFCGWCASGLRDVVKDIEWIPKKENDGGQYRSTVGQALIDIKGDKDTGSTATTNNLSTLTENCQYLSPLTGELYTAVSATFGGTYLSWVLYLSDALEGGLKSLSEAFRNIECRGCKGQCDPNKCKKGSHGATGNALCNCTSIVSCTGVLPVLYRHGFSYGNPFNLEGYHQRDEKNGDYSIEKVDKGKKRCHEFLESLNAVIKKKEEATSQKDQHPLSNLLTQVGKLQYDIRLPWIFVLTVAWLVAVLYLAFGAIWPLDWTHMRSHWLRGGEHQWQCMWYKVMTGRKGMDLMEYFGRR